jgi:hypothetical protein
VPAWLYQRLNCVNLLRQGRVRIGVCNGLRKIVASDSLAVVSLEIQLHALGKACLPSASPGALTKVCIMRTTSAPFS